MPTHRRLLVALGLLVLSTVALEGVRHCGFVAFDDDVLVYLNPNLRNGLSWAGVRWAFGANLFFDSPNMDYWTPLTALSRLVDVELFGLHPAGHHLTNLALHAVAVVLLFVTFESMTGELWRSAFVAAIMAVHPLHVESVAWVTERKDVLSAVFFMLSLGAYARYVRQPTPLGLAKVATCQALGLLAKPMLVTLPFLLLLLDVWPFRRVRLGESGAWAQGLRLAISKWPLFLLSSLSLVATYVPLLRRGNLTSLQTLPLGERLGNALQAYVVYLRQTVWPHPLAIPYPYPVRSFSWQVPGAALALLCLTGAALWTARVRPWLLVGWLWFLGMLVPVVGLVQSGDHAHADRYMYLPSIGLSLILAWGVPDLLSLGRMGRLAPALGCAAIAACVPVTRAQVRYWESTVTLFTHAIAVTGPNPVARNNLAVGLALAGDLSAAELHYREAIRIEPGYWQARMGLGTILAREGRLPEATEQQWEAARLNPRSADVHFNLGALAARTGAAAAAEAQYAEALRLNPDMAVAHYNWGNLLAAGGRWAEAEAHFSAAARLDPEHADAWNNLGLAIGLQGRWAQALPPLERAVRLAPELQRARLNLGRALGALGRPAEARVQWQAALSLDPHSPDAEEARQKLGP